MKEVEAALLEDQESTTHLQESVVKLQESQLARKIAKDVAISGAGAATDSLYIAGLVSGGSGGAGVLGKVGTEAMAKIFGEDVGKEASFLIQLLKHSN